MPLREGLGKPILSWVWFFAGIAWIVRLSWKYGIVPKQEHRRDPNSGPFFSFWSLFSYEKWTDEGVALHKRLVLELLAFGAIWVLAAAVFSLL
jgi:hypothetical protein